MPRIRRLDREVTSQYRRQREERAHAVGRGCETVGAEAGKGVRHVGCGVGGLDGGDETEGVEAELVGWVDDLGVFDAVAGGVGLAGVEAGR